MGKINIFLKEPNCIHKFCGNYCDSQNNKENAGVKKKGRKMLNEERQGTETDKSLIG